MKNQKGISLIALIITIIVIIILAAIVIGGVFNTPNDAKFAAFCQEYDRVQTAIQVKYYDLYLDYSISQSTDVLPTHYNLYNEVATGTPFAGTNEAQDDVDNWTEITDAGWAKLCEKPDLAGTWFLRESDGKLVYSGFERAENEMYLTPNVQNPLASDTRKRPTVAGENDILEVAAEEAAKSLDLDATGAEYVAPGAGA